MFRTIMFNTLHEIKTLNSFIIVILWFATFQYVRSQTTDAPGDVATVGPTVAPDPTTLTASVIPNSGVSGVASGTLSSTSRKYF